jgi:O-antigen ligase
MAGILGDALRRRRLLGLAAFCMLHVAIAVALALLPVGLAAALLLGGVAATFALLSPLAAVCLAVLSVPVQELVQLPGGITVTQAALVLALGSLVLHTLANPERPLAPGRIFAPLLILLWCMALSALLTPYSLAEAVRETSRWATVPLIYLLALRAAEGTENREQGRGAERLGMAPVPWAFVACLILAPALTAVVGLVQFWFGLGPESFQVAGGRVRAYGTIGQPNSFAGYMNQAWPLAAGVALSALASLLSGSRRPGARIALFWAGLGAALLLAALLVSFSRGGWVGGLAGAAALALGLLARLPGSVRPLVRRLLGAGVAGAVALGILGGGGLLPTTLTARATSLAENLRLFDARGADITPENFAVVERMAHLQAGWNMLARRPLLGVGPGNYSVAYERTPGPGEPPISVRPWYDSRGHAHNYYLNMAAEAGLLGLGAYLLLLGAVFSQAVRAVLVARGWAWRGLAAGGAGVVGAVAAHNLFENLHVLNMGLQLGSVWALLVIVERANQAAQDRSSPW